jgi:hypothetical protein
VAVPFLVWTGHAIDQETHWGMIQKSEFPAEGPDATPQVSASIMRAKKGVDLAR